MEISLRLKSICEELELKEVTLHMPDSLARLTVAMPSSAMELVLEEILDNSKKFHPNHDPRIEMQINQKNEQTVLITIIDNGLTLSVDQLEWAWHPYFQGEKHFTGEIPGMGLGFPTVATLVWQSGGQLKISNRIPGPGVIVEIALPLAMEKTNV
jgi:K+-sensing histidine kinase KdpD